jgi:type II secretory pathway component GspD/PulD (secretin)
MTDKPYARSILLISAVFLGVAFTGDYGRAEREVRHPSGEMKGTVSVNFENTDIERALRILSEVTGLNIAAGSEITGKVTARLVDVTVEEALNSILRSCGYGFIVEGSVVRVVKASEEILGLDRHSPQVHIKSQIVEVNLGDTRNTGVNWKDLSGELGNDLRITGETLFPEGSSGVILNLFSGDVDAVINLMEETTETNVLSEPSIVAINGREAMIMVGEKIAYQQSFGQASAGITTTSVQFEDVGIKLNVTPHIRGKEWILLDVRVEVSSVKEWRTLSNGDEVPIISSKETSTKVMIRNNSTLIIGGLIGNNRTEKESRVPVLGDIPLLGYLFRRTEVEVNRTDLNVFITPSVIETGSGG